MSGTLDLVRACVKRGEVRVSRHGAAELRSDGIELAAVLDSTVTSVEDYPSAFKGPTILALHVLDDGTPIHVVWGFAVGRTTPAVLVTAYRPDPQRWSVDFTTRRAR